jgi:hypothetical protein
VRRKTEGVHEEWTGKKPPQHLRGRCVISRSAELFRIRSTMAPIWLAYVESCQRKTLACQTPRSLGAASQRWAGSQRNNIVATGGATRQTPRGLVHYLTYGRNSK